MDPPQKVITWSRPATFGAPPSPRGGHTAVLVGNLFVVFGGTRTDTEGAAGTFRYLSDVFVLDTDTMRWHCPTLVGRSPPARYCHTAVVLDYKMYICGGRGEKGALYNDVWALDVERWEWQLLPTSTAAPPSPRMGHCAAAVGPTKFMLFGGWDGGAAFFSDTWLFDVAALCWTKLKVTGIAPSPRHGHSAVYDETNSRVIVFGGWSQHPGGYPVYQSDARQFDVKSASWSRVATTGDAPTPRYAHASTVIGNVMIVTTGWSGPRDAAVVEASVPTGTITLAHPTAASTGGSKGGALTTLPYGPGDCFFLDVDSNEWVQPHIAGQPPLYRYGSSLVAAGPAALLWGGWESGRPMNDLWLLDLSALAAVVAAPSEE